MSELSEECFADEKSGYGSAVDENNNHATDNHDEMFDKESVKSDENDCVFDKNWAWERKCSMSSLLYSRLLWRLKSISTKTALQTALKADIDTDELLRRENASSNYQCDRVKGMEKEHVNASVQISVHARSVTPSRNSSCV